LFSPSFSCRLPPGLSKETKGKGGKKKRVSGKKESFSLDSAVIGTWRVRGREGKRKAAREKGNNSPISFIPVCPVRRGKRKRRGRGGKNLTRKKRKNIILYPDRLPPAAPSESERKRKGKKKEKRRN